MIKYARIYRKKNKIIISQKKHIYYLQHKKERSIANKKWRKANPHKILANFHKRKAIKMLVTFEDCAEKIKLLKTAKFCCYCKGILNKKNLTIDHIIPLSRGGYHISNNLVACCRTCNCSKGIKLLKEWTLQPIV
jgi:5-methylcytosine-specific restriction endonuclease McrA